MSVNIDPIVNGLEPVVSKFSPNGTLITVGILGTLFIAGTVYCHHDATQKGHAFKSKPLGIESAPAQHVYVNR